MMVVMLIQVAVAADRDVPFSPDRPGYADSTGSVPAGHLLTEAGIQLASQSGTSVLGIPQLSVRGGLTRRLELRLSVPSVRLPLGEGQAAMTGSAVGLKVATPLGEDTALSVVGMLPVAAGPLEQALGTPSLRANASHSIGDFGVTATAGVSPGAVLGWGGCLAGGYGPFYAQAALEGSGDTLSPLVGAGAAITPREALQLDASVDVLPAGGAVRVGAGVARQW